MEQTEKLLREVFASAVPDLVGGSEQERDLVHIFATPLDPRLEKLAEAQVEQLLIDIRAIRLAFGGFLGELEAIERDLRRSRRKLTTESNRAAADEAAENARRLVTERLKASYPRDIGDSDVADESPA